MNYCTVLLLLALLSSRSVSVARERFHFCHDKVFGYPFCTQKDMCSHFIQRVSAVRARCEVVE